MISVNLSHDTLLPPGDEGQALKRALGLETRRVDFELTDENGVTSARSAEFVQTERKGILPRILQNLLQQRKATRAKIKLCDDPFERGVLDGLQLAYKLTSNSIYGQVSFFLVFYMTL
jgi:DNA polymerase delta subunit 1